jgi:4-aminobutyrate aminotransferase
MACVSFLEDVVFAKHTPPEDVAAVVVEPIQGEGGYIAPPPGFFEKLQALCRKYGILLVADEVQSGMGRTGKWWAIEHWKASPDVTVVAKGIASGLPLGATIARADLMKWPPGSHGNTFGGNPVASAAALATIDLIRTSLLDNVKKVGSFLERELNKMVERRPSLGWVSGKGLMLGLEVVAEPGTTKTDTARREAIVNAAYERGLLLLGAGPSSIRIAPALTVSREQAQIALEILEDSVRDVEEKTAKKQAPSRPASRTRARRAAGTGS